MGAGTVDAAREHKEEYTGVAAACVVAHAVVLVILVIVVIFIPIFFVAADVAAAQ